MHSDTVVAMHMHYILNESPSLMCVKLSKHYLSIVGTAHSHQVCYTFF
jgi:hypothetical protein